MSSSPEVEHRACAVQIAAAPHLLVMCAAPAASRGEPIATAVPRRRASVRVIGASPSRRGRLRPTPDPQNKHLACVQERDKPGRAVHFRKRHREFRVRGLERRLSGPGQHCLQHASIAYKRGVYERVRAGVGRGTVIAKRTGIIQGTTMAVGLRQSMISLAGLAIVVAVLVFVDPRVRDRFGALVSGSNTGSLADRAGELGGALMTALRYQSIENAPLLIFATIGAVLFVFMVRT
jgi:hypothetical protein